MNETYKILMANAKDLGQDAVNELYKRMALLVESHWPDSTSFVFPDSADMERDLHSAKDRGSKNVS